MSHEHADHRPRLLGLVLLVGLLLGVTLAAPAQNAAPRGEDRSSFFFKEREFAIPFRVAPYKQAKQVFLWASTDGKVFSVSGNTGPQDEQFTYKAEKDGWHYFVVQIEDVQGRKDPAKVDSSAVSLQVCVDTVPPKASLKEVIPEEGRVGVEWDLEDDRQLNLKRLRLEYRPAKGDAKWIPLPVKQMPKAHLGWSPEPGEYEARIVAYDMAGNSTEAKTKVTVKDGPSNAPNAPNSPARPTGEPEVKFVQKKTFKLQYKIENEGPSKVKNVEVWMTRDKRQWTKFRDDAPADPGIGYELKVGAAGRYGFTLRPVSGVGRASRVPNVGEAPQIWIEVDETPPAVQITGVTVGEGEDDGTITVNWLASDKWLKPNGITIKYATSSDGKEGWQVLQTNLPHTGTAKVSTKAVASSNHEFYLRVEAEDEAGNVGSDQTKDTVKVDTKVPTVKVIGVTGSGP